MRKLLFAFVLVAIFASVAQAQLGNVRMFHYVGTPPAGNGACSRNQQATNDSSGALYNCDPANGTWVAVAGSGSFTAGGDLSGTSSSQTVIGINGTLLSGLASGILYNATGTGVPSIATSAQIVSACTGCAITALSNLASVSINTSLLAQTGVDAGSTTKPFRNLFLWGTGTYGSTYEEITGAPTGSRVWTLQDASDTIVGRATTDTLTNKTLTTPTINSATLAGASTVVPSGGTLTIQSGGTLTCSAGSTCPSGTGTVTVVGAGSLTSTAIITGGGTTTLQTPSATSTMDSSGDMTLAGTLAVGGSTSGIDMACGTAATIIAANVGFTPPSSCASGNGHYNLPTLPSSAGIMHIGAASSNVSALTSSLIAIADLSATGTPSSTTFLRGDNSWATPSGSGTVTSVATTAPLGGGTITTTGTLTCTTCTTNASALTSNVLVKGGGGQATQTSSITDNATTVTSTDTGGYVAPVFVANGSTAGFHDYPQGSTSAAVAPCNTANSICEQAPTSVTAYVLNKPGAAPVNNQSGSLCSNASPSVCAFAKMPQTAITSGSAYTNATTGFTSVVGGSGQTLSFSVEASTNYVMSCQVLWSASAATAGPKFQFTGPASPTAVQYSVTSGITATTAGDAGATAFSTSLNAVGATVTSSTLIPSELNVGLVNGTTAGTVTLQAAAQGTGTLTIEPGSWCQLQ